MKVVKYLIITTLVIFTGWCVWAVTLPSKMHIERSLLIQSDPNTTFGPVNDLTQWIKWSYWDNIDPNMKTTFEGPNAGVGAIHLWESTNDSVGKGSIEILKSDAGKLVEYKLTFEGMGESIGGWVFQDSAGATKVTCYMDMETPFMLRPMMALVDMDAMLGADFMKSLNGLKTLVESFPKWTPVAMEEVDAAPMNVVTMKVSCTPSEISKTLGETYGKIGAMAGKAGSKQAGPVFAIYMNYTDTKVDMEVGFIVDKLPVKTDEGFNAYSTTHTKALKVSYFGGYKSMYPFHMGISEWLKVNGKDVHAPRWELYITDPGAEPDSTKWQTDIVIPQ
ncbi:MAG: SRPBCC family protein [Bacteroidia bacterium]|nr:SRPBCC family protein [Bacteroidia bacterium]